MRNNKYYDVLLKKILNETLEDKANEVMEKLGINVVNLPLSAYRYCSFYTMRTDSLDRFGTRLEQRFTKNQINQMMIESGLKNISFNETVPFWCAVGTKI